MRPLFYAHAGQAHAGCGRHAGARLCALAMLGLLLAVLAPAVYAEPGATPRGGALLVASARLPDARFRQTVLLLIEADEQGALGVVINRPLPGTLDDVMPDMPRDATLSLPLFSGGPVEPGRVTVLLRTGEDAPGLQPVLEGVKATMAMESLQGLLQGTPPVRAARAYLGYAGWAPGQLENEIARGDWHVLETSAEEVFETPVARLWPRLRRRAAGTWVWSEPAPWNPARTAPPLRVCELSNAVASASIGERDKASGVKTRELGDSK